MIFTLAFLGVLAAGAGWWLARQGGLAEKPWLRTGVIEQVATPRAVPGASAKLGLGVLITVGSALLLLLVSAYSMRMQMPDWRPPPQPRLLWANTGVLVLSSVALQWAVVAARRGHLDGVKDGLLFGGMTALLFIAGQVLAWRELAAAGYLLATNPADAFFYLITAAHGLHLAGGLVALARTGNRLRRSDGLAPERLRLSVELCAVYWHFLLVAWLVLFGLLAFSPSLNWLYEICTAPFR